MVEVVAKLFSYKTQSREGLILQWNNGFGEIAPLPGYSKETLEEAKEEILRNLPNLPDAKPTLPSVQFGLFAASKPLSLNPLRVPISALNHPKLGCNTLKLKVKNLSLTEAIELVKKYLGKYRLRIDCNRSWTLSQALFFASHFSRTDFEYLEEPTQTFEELELFSKKTLFPIALDESLRENVPYGQIPTLQAFIVKPTLMGIIPKLPPEIPVVFSSSYESSLGLLQIARLASGTIPHGLDTVSDDFLIPPLRIENGYLTWNPSPNPINFSKLCLIATAP